MINFCDVELLLLPLPPSNELLVIEGDTAEGSFENLNEATFEVKTVAAMTPVDLRSFISDDMIKDGCFN